MKGSHHIAIESSRLKYEFDIKRNITIIQGDSATGKTTLIDLLNTYGRYGVESGIMLNSDVPCIVFSANPITWQDTLKTYNDSIIFFDEDYSFIFSKDFAETIRDSSNYYDVGVKSNPDIIILKSGIIKVDNIDNILERPEDFIESRDFFSWERFFEDILVKATIDDPIRRYSKSKLSSFYYEDKNKDSILSIMPKGVFDKII